MIIRKNVLSWVTLALAAFFLNQAVSQQGPGLSTSAGKQQGLNRGLEALYRTLEDKNKRNTNFESYTSVDGSAYYDEQFQKGMVYYNGELMGSPFLRYDAYADEIQIKKTLSEEEAYGALLKTDALWCRIGNDKMTYQSLRDEKGEVTTGYVSHLISGEKYLLFERQIKLFQEGKIAATSLTASINPKFIDKVSYYMATEDKGEAKEIPKSKKEVVLLFAEADRPAIKSYIKKKRLKLNERNDLVTLFYYANSL